MRLAVETRDPKLEESVKQNDTRIAAVLKFLKEAGIESQGRADRLRRDPSAVQHDRRVQQIVPEYYQVRRNLGVRLRKAPQFDPVLAGALRTA